MIPVTLAVAALFSLAACGADGTSEPVTRIAAPSETNEIDEAEIPGAVSIAPTLLAATTYDGSGELVHPDVVFFPRSWQGRRYWLAATPYPGGDPKFENPSIFNASTARELLVPAGVTNPLALPDAKAYFSDPDLAFDPARAELRMYYRHTLQAADQLYVTTSKNGVQWSKGQLVLAAPRWTLISPAIVRETTGEWRMWSVNASISGCQSTTADVTLQQRRSADGMSWGEPEAIQLRIPGRVPWHLDVQWIPAKGEYWSLIAAYPDKGTCSQTAIYFARSTDGTSWRVSPSPLLAAGGFEPIRDLVYRSTFHYHDGSDAVSVWFSGARLEGPAFHYAVASARYPLPELLRRVSGVSAATLERDAAREHPSAQLDSARAAFVRAFP